MPWTMSSSKKASATKVVQIAMPTLEDLRMSSTSSVVKYKHHIEGKDGQALLFLVLKALSTTACAQMLVTGQRINVNGEKSISCEEHIGSCPRPASITAPSTMGRIHVVSLS